MEMHDYEYYEARAREVKLEDITSDEHNKDILGWLRDEDPELKCITITTLAIDWSDFVVRRGDHLGWLGYFVCKNKQLETLSIGSLPDNINLDAFFEVLGQNRSIKTLQIGSDIGESFQKLVPFVRNNDSLHELSFNYFDIGLQCARNIALLLGQQRTLKCLDFEEMGFDDEGFSQIAKAVRSQPQIEKLRLCCGTIGRDGYAALGSALEGCSSLRNLSIMTAIDLEVNDIGNEGLLVLAEGLKHCHDIRELVLFGNLMVTEEGLRSLSTLFQSDNCRLELLELGQMNIGDDGMTVLATGITSLPSLKRLTLWDTFIGDQGLQDLVRGLVNCNLEELNFSKNEVMESISGLRLLGTLVRRSTNMRSLSLYNSSLTDEGLQSFVEGMANYCNLTDLNLSHNHSITANGLESLSSLFQAEHCSLRTLSLCGIHFGDDGAAALANGLIGNKSLTNLKLSTSGIVARGWDAFSELLCDTSSVNNTYLSNHTLVEVGEHAYRLEDTPRDIRELLKWNKLQNQAAAICKILHSHPDIDITPFLQWKMKCLPLVVAWLEKAKLYIENVNETTESFQRRQLSAVYKFVRGMPQLAVDGYHSQKTNDTQSHAQKKRKFDQLA